jgi:hypothetical protein
MDDLRWQECRTILSRPKINPCLVYPAMFREYYIRLKAAVEYYGYAIPAAGIPNAFLTLLLEQPSFQLDTRKVLKRGAPQKVELAVTKELLVAAIKDVGRTNDKGVLTKAVKKVHRELSRRENQARQQAERWPNRFQITKTPSEKRLFNILTGLRQKPFAGNPELKGNDQPNYLESDLLAKVRILYSESAARLTSEFGYRSSKGIFEHIIASGFLMLAARQLRNELYPPNPI